MLCSSSLADSVGSHHLPLCFAVPASSSPKPVLEPISGEDSDDITNEVLLDDEVTIKQFVAVETLEEQGPVRAVAFHPSGDCYAVGSNTKVWL